MTNRTTPSALSQNTPPRYALRKGLGCWELTFAGRRALLKHEQGIFYVAHLLANPPQQPLHALALALRAKADDRCASACVELLDPETGESTTLGKATIFQQRGL